MGTGGRPPDTEKTEGTEEVEEPLTPRELENRLFPEVRPDSPWYLSRREKTLRVTLRELLAHITNPKNQKYYKPAGKPPISVDLEKVNVKTITFLEQPQYKELLARYWELYTKASNDVIRLKGKVDKDREKQLEFLCDEISKFGAGILGNKRPDKAEFIIDRRQVDVRDEFPPEFATTDASFVWYKPFHNFKHQVYVAAIKAATGLEGAGLEIETFKKSRLIEVEPATEPATEKAAPPKEE